MTPADITAIIGTAIALLTSVIVPWVLRRRQSADIASATDLASWQGIVANLKEEREEVKREREDLRGQLKALQVEYKAHITAVEKECQDRITALEAALEADYTAKIAVLAAENAHQQEAIAGLSVRLVRQTPPSAG